MMQMRIRITGTDNQFLKQVMVLKNPADDLGMAIIGGIEHNLPIIISEVFPNSAVARASKVPVPVSQC
jgi:hypothetical protein